MNTKSDKQETRKWAKGISKEYQEKSVRNIKKQETKLITENYQQRKPSELTN